MTSMPSSAHNANAHNTSNARNVTSSAISAASNDNIGRNYHISSGITLRFSHYKLAVITAFTAFTAFIRGFAYDKSDERLN